MDLISVIVPVYKVEKYLDRCVKSIVNQSYKNLEIILVDDGSPDNCPKMCDEWAEKDSRIKVIHKENGGQSDARNFGIESSHGEYIAFIDSDDWILPTFLQSMYIAAIEYSADIVACDAQFVYDNSYENSEITNIVTTYTPEQALDTLISGDVFRAVVWNKLYRRSIIGNHRFVLGKYRDDEFITYKLLGASKKLVFIHDKLYFYVQHPDSIMNTTSVKHLDALDAYVERLHYFNVNFPNIYIKDKCAFCFACIAFYSNYENIPKEQQHYYRKRIRSTRKQINFSFRELSLYNPKQILYIFGSRFFIGLFTKVLSLKRKQNDATSQKNI